MRRALAAITASKHLMALHIVVSAVLMLAGPVVACSLLGLEVSDQTMETVRHAITAIAGAGGVVITASATRHTGEGWRQPSSQTEQFRTPVVPVEMPPDYEQAR